MSKPPAHTTTSLNGTSANASAKPPEREKTYFEQQRELLLKDVGVSFESVLQNINKLNRSLEGIVAVGGEFSSVEALWSHFENVMAKDGQQASPQQQQQQKPEHEDRNDDGQRSAGDDEAAGAGAKR